mmetsp:Transcript_8198/g.12966  ORF Transcript_8198/g.12966 Transcript_8198/m.12966 type:complete len:252 (+) Transcript_8198:2-757(+)
MKFVVEFPKKESQKKLAKSPTPKSKTPTTKRKAKTTTGKSKSKSTRTFTETSPVEEDGMDNGLQFNELGDDSSDDSLAAATVASRSTKRDTPSLLPPEHTRKLVDKLKSLTGLWAKEEQEMGNHVFYWHIMTTATMKTIANSVPMTTEELSALGVLGEKILDEYGSRLIRQINSFVQTEKLSEYVQNRPIKRAKTDEASPAIPPAGTSHQPGATREVIDIEDEFAVDIDFAAIPLPEVTSTMPSTSSHFNK